MPDVPFPEMAITGATIRAVVFVLLAGVLAAVIIGVLLLFGVEPHLVFTPGFLVKSFFERLGFHVPNAVGVMSTVLLVWGVIVGVRLAVGKIAGHRAA